MTAQLDLPPAPWYHGSMPQPADVPVFGRTPTYLKSGWALAGVRSLFYNTTRGKGGEENVG